MIHECAEINTHCTCALKDTLLQQLIELHEMNPQDDDHWFNALRGKDACIGEYTPCCLIIYLCFYAYFEEVHLSISEHARHALAPIINQH